MAQFMGVRKLPVVMLGEEYPLPNRVSIETTSYCNRVCSFCPISNGGRNFFTSMTDELYVKIIRELWERHWNGNLQLFLLNEPLLDKALLKRAAFARKALPECTMYISTNGDVIDYKGSKTLEYSLKRLKDIFDSGINSVNINIYDSGPAQAERYERIVSAAVHFGLAKYTTHKYRRLSPRSNWIALTDMRPERMSASATDMFYKRSEDDRRDVIAPQTYCARTQRHLVILYDGTVPICCAIDPTSKEMPVVGNINNSSIHDIWNSEMVFKYRYYTQNAQRVLPGCDTCGHKMSYSYFVRLVDAEDEVKHRWDNSLRAYQKSVNDGTYFQPQKLVQLQPSV